MLEGESQESIWNVELKKHKGKFLYCRSLGFYMQHCDYICIAVFGLLFNWKESPTMGTKGKKNDKTITKTVE